MQAHIEVLCGYYLLMHICSKWPEVHAMSFTTAQATIQQLRKIFATHGLRQILFMIMDRNLCQVNLSSSVTQGAFSTTLLLLIIPGRTGKPKD